MEKSPQIDPVIYIALCKALRDIDQRVIIYYALLLTYHRNLPRSDDKIRDELRDKSTNSIASFETIVAHLSQMNILHPTSLQILNNKKQFDLLTEIIRVGSEKITNVQLGNFPRPPTIYSFNGFPPPMDGVKCFEASDDDRIKLLVEPALKFFESFQDGGVNFEIIEKMPRNRGFLLTLYTIDIAPVLVVQIVNSSRVSQRSEVDALTDTISQIEKSREYLYADSDVIDSQTKTRAKTVVGLVVSTSYSEKFANGCKIGRPQISLTGPANLPPLIHYLENKLKNVPENKKREVVLNAFHGLVDFLRPHGGFHSGGVFVADELIDTKWEPLFR